MACGVLTRPAKWLALAAALGGLAACMAAAPQRLGKAGGTPVALATSGFTVKGRYYPAGGAAPAPRLWVVIEGDGARWSGGKPPRDPTPRRPMGPALAASLPQGDARLYLARPCQFLSPEALARCAPRYWAEARFSKPVIAAADRLISRYRQAGQKVVLIGYSGGGVLAAELALRRADIGGLVTLAAPLDLESWSRVHALPRLASPTPPRALLGALARKPFPRRFVFGSADDVVPPAAIARLRRLLPSSTVVIVPGFRHGAAWQKLWQKIGMPAWLAQGNSAARRP